MTQREIDELRERAENHGVVNQTAVVVVTAAELYELLDAAEKQSRPPKDNEVIVTLERSELKALRAAVEGDDFDVRAMSTALQKLRTLESV